MTAGRFWAAANGVRARLFLVTILAVAPFVWVQYRDFPAIEQAMVDGLRGQATNQATALTTRVHGALAEVRTLLSALSRGDGMVTNDNCIAVLAEFRSELGWARSINVLDTTGRITCSSEASFIGSQVIREEFRQAVEKRRFAVSDFFVGNLRGAPTLAAALPVFDESGRLRYALVVALELSWLAASADPEDEILFVNGSGQVLARFAYGKAQPVGGDATAGFEAAAVGASHSVVESNDASGVRRVYAIGEIEGSRGQIAVGLSLADIEAQTRSREQRAIFRVASAIIIIFLLAFVGGELLFLRPLRGLIRATDEIAAGDLGARAKVRHASTEIERLARTFNTMAARLERLANVDALTGIANRRHFDVALSQAWQRATVSGKSLALCLIDVDRFKAYNDRYGHPAGDEVLRRVAGELKRFARRSGDFVARHGGEEFAVMLSGNDEQEALAWVESLRATVAELAIPHSDSAAGIVTISAGVAAVTPDADSAPSQLMALADTALYAAKAAGRNRVRTAGAAAPVVIRVA